MIGNSLRALARLAAAAACLTTLTFAQAPSNASVKGSYYVRYIGENTSTSAVMSYSGTMVFDGAGKYTITGAGLNSKTSDKVLKTTTGGSYTVLSNGMLTVDNPFDTAGNIAGPIFGGVGNGVLIGSSTEGGYVDLFVAIPAATAASNTTLNGTYTMVSLEFLNGSLTQTRQTLSQVTSTGAGTLGNLTIKGTAQSLNDAATVQTSTGATYSLTPNGTGTLTIPAPSGVTAANTLLSGAKVLYAAADGSFFIAGGANAYDLEIGVKQGTGSGFDGIYFSSYLQNYATGSSADALYAVSGSTNAIGSIKKLIAHERTNSEISYPYDYTYTDAYNYGADGSSTSGLQVLGAGGNILISTGPSGGNYLLSVYVKSVPATPTGSVVIFPQGVVNAANNVPFTAQFSPGEVVTLYGSGFGTQTLSASSLPFPNSLGNVSVNVAYKDANNATVNLAAPVYFVSPGQLSAVLPYNMPGDGTSITLSVTANGTKSNEVTVYSGPSSPGIFTQPVGGIGSGAVLHADFSLVTAASPAKSGETIQVFLTGLGALDNSTAAGAAGPTNPFAKTKLPVDIGLLDDAGNFYDGTIVYSGLAPNLGGLYQVNVTLPANLPTGVVTLSIYVGDGSDYGDGWNEMATLNVVK